MANERVPTAFPPGAVLEEELEARGWSQTDLATILGRPAKLVNELIAGKRAITPETAHGLADALGTSAELWMNLEVRYQLAKAAKPDASVSRRAELFDVAPIKEMQRRGWIDSTDDPDELRASICRFFDVQALDAIRGLPHAAKKSISYYEPVTPAQRAWVQYVRNIGASVDVGRTFTNAGLESALARLRSLLHSTEEVRHVPRILAEAGIRLVVVEHLAGTGIDGVCLWLDDSSPVIAVTIRFDRIDHFWFALAHELGHVYAGDGKDVPVLDVDLFGGDAVKSSDKPVEEQRADAFAAEFLIPSVEMQSFIARVSPLYSKERIKGFAARLQIHPGIVVGQLQHRDQIKYSHSREMLEKIRRIVTASALTDGWSQQAS